MDTTTATTNFPLWATIIIAIFGALGGASGIVSIISLFQSRKKLAAEVESIKQQNEQASMEFVKKSLQELTETYKADQADSKKQNAELQQQVDQLRGQITSLMNWIVNDNHKYRLWLESKLREKDPSIEFPEVSDPPNVFQTSKAE